MGCDYYIWLDTVIQYIDLSGTLQSVIDSDKKCKRYIREPHDWDFEEPYGINDEIREYGKKIMFEKGAWYCLPCGKQRIQEICTDKQISFDSIVTVFKFKNGYVCK